MVPKIEFRWSWIYEQEMHNSFVKSEKDIKRRERQIKKFINNVRKEWNKKESKILKFMAKITGLNWKTKNIVCYVIWLSEKGPISDPLTIPIQLKVGKKVFKLTPQRFIDILVHELIHNLFIQNKKVDKYFDYLIKKKYKKESMVTAIHVPVHAIHKEIYLKFFNKKRLKIEKEICKSYSDYTKAWEIVEREGSKKIIEELKNFY